MVVDLSRVSLGNWVADGALTVVEQIPGLVEYSDQTQALRQGEAAWHKDVCVCVCVCVCVYICMWAGVRVCACASLLICIFNMSLHTSLSPLAHSKCLFFLFPLFAPDPQKSIEVRHFEGHSNTLNVPSRSLS